jgi:magnesium transporter
VDDGGEFRSDLREIHRLKRQVTLCKRLLWRTVDVTQRMVPHAGKAAALLRDVQENAESYHFYADELLDDANTLLNVQLALASQRTSEVMRVLTVFSVFFLPLTFIVGVYGMNFKYMPELRERWGYPAVLFAMAVVTFAIHRWFRVRGWLRR